MRRIAKFAIVVAALSLTACGGGGGNSTPTLTDDQINEINNDPRIVRLERIAEGADTLITSAVHADATLSALGETVHEHALVRLSCAGTRCTSDQGDILTLNDLLNPTTDIDFTGIGFTAVTISAHEGFDTVDADAQLDISETLPGITLSSTPAATTFGAWGQHGYASVGIVDGPISGRYEGTQFSGDLAFTFALVTGDASGTNPAGIGGATWQGLARAVSTRTYAQREGTATISISDLANPAVSVDIDIDGRAIGSTAWTDIPLTAGHFRTGTQDHDFVDGHFFGPDHSETYGVFDTSAYAGIFAAREQ